VSLTFCAVAHKTHSGKTQQALSNNSTETHFNSSDQEKGKSLIQTSKEQVLMCWLTIHITLYLQIGFSKQCLEVKNKAKFSQNRSDQMKRAVFVAINCVRTKTQHTVDMAVAVTPIQNVWCVALSIISRKASRCNVLYVARSGQTTQSIFFMKILDFFGKNSKKVQRLE
jgi:hypothetical protein